MSYAQFVDKIDANPTVRLDIDDQVAWKLLANGTDLGTPPINRAVVSTLLTDGVRIPASAYGARTLTLSLDIKAATADAAASQFQRLARELDRPVNFLRWQPDTSQPVFFRLFRGEMTNVQFDPVLKRAVAVMLAEPFAYGLRETLPDITLNKDPAAATNPTYFDVTGVKGDVPAVTQINVGPMFTIANQPSTLAVRRRGDPANVPYLRQAESMTQGTDTTAQPNDAAMSGTGNNYSRCTFSTNAGMVTRLEYGAPSPASVDARGQYRVFLRYRRSSSTDVIDIRLIVGPGSVLETVISTVRTEATTSVRHADLGVIQLPLGHDPVFDGPSGAEIPVTQNTARIGIQAQRVSGAGTIDFDLVLLTPADDKFLAFKVGSDSTGNIVFDSHADMGYGFSFSAGTVDSASDIVPLGGLPELSPGVTNRIYARFGDGISGSQTIKVAYWPCYMYVKPAVES